MMNCRDTSMKIVWVMQNCIAVCTEEPLSMSNIGNDFSYGAGIIGLKSDTSATYQLIIYTSGEYLHGELRCDRRPERIYHIQCRNQFFSQEADGVYRNNQIYRLTVDAQTGVTLGEEEIGRNHAKIAYDPEGLELVDRTKS